MRKLPVSVLIVALVTLAVGCGGRPTSPTPVPLPTPTTPPGFVTFTDELNVFSISYPSAWQLDLSSMSELDAFARNLVESATGGPRAGLRLIFSAGVDAQEGSIPNVVVNVETLPVGLTLDEYFEGGQRFMRSTIAAYRVHKQAKVLLGRTEAIVYDVEFDPSSFMVAGSPSKGRAISLVAVDRAIGWTVTCTVKVPTRDDDLQTCDAVARSFRVLR